MAVNTAVPANNGPVAVYNGKEFTNLQDAANATLKYKVLKLMADVTVEELNIKESITIDLNGYSLEGVTINIKAGKTLTLIGEGGLIAAIEGNVNLNGANVGKATVTNGTFTIKAGTVTEITLGEGGVLKGTFANAAKINAAAHVLNYSKAMFGYYGDIYTALAATAKSYTLVLDSNVKLTKALEPTVSIALNLNGKTISGNVEAGQSLIINTKGLTISDSSEEKTGAIVATFTGSVDNSKSANTITNRSTLTVNAGKIVNNGSTAQIGYAIDNLAGATLTVKGGEITANGGYNDAIRLCCNASAETKVTVSGGVISSIWAQNPTTDKAGEVKGTVQISGGEISIVYYENYTTVKVKGGTVNNIVAYGDGTAKTPKKDSAGWTVYAFQN